MERGLAFGNRIGYPGPGDDMDAHGDDGRTADEIISDHKRQDALVRTRKAEEEIETKYHPSPASLIDQA